MTDKNRKTLLEKLEEMDPGYWLEFDCELKDMVYGDYICYTFENYKIYLFNNYSYICENNEKYYACDISNYEDWDFFVQLVKKNEVYENGKFEKNEENSFFDYEYYYLINYHNIIKDINDKKYSIEEQLDEFFNKYYSTSADKDIFNLKPYSYRYYDIYSDKEDKHLKRLYIAKYNSLKEHNKETLIETKLFNGADLHLILDFDIHTLYRKIQWYNIIYNEWFDGLNVCMPYDKSELEDISNKPYFKVGNITIIYGKDFMFYNLLEDDGWVETSHIPYEEYGKEKPFMEFKDEIIELFESNML